MAKSFKRFFFFFCSPIYLLLIIPKFYGIQRSPILGPSLNLFLFLFIPFINIVGLSRTLYLK